MKIQNIYSATSTSPMKSIKSVKNINSVNNTHEKPKIENNNINVVDTHKKREMNLSSAYKTVGMGNFINITA